MGLITKDRMKIVKEIIWFSGFLGVGVYL